MKDKCILVIDNDMESARLISKTLEPEGYLVFTASSGPIGIMMAKKINPLLIFLDLTTPNTNGLQICRDIHNIRSLSNVPIILFTAHEEGYEPRYQKTYGIIDFLKKPLIPEKLISKTNKALADTKDVTVQRDYGTEESPDREVEFQGAEEVAAGEPHLAEVLQEDLWESEELTSAEAQELTDKEAVTEEIKIEAQPPQAEAEGLQIRDEGKKEIKQDAVHTEIKDMAFDEVRRRKQIECPILRNDAMKGRLTKKGRKRGIVFAAISLSAIGVLIAAAYIVFRPYEKPATPVPQKSVQNPQPRTSVIPEAVQHTDKAALPQSETTAKQVLKPKAEKPLSSKPVYSVQAGAFRDKNNAENLAKKLKDKGYEAVFKEDSRQGKTIYRVLVGRFDDRKTASTLAKEIKIKEKIMTLIYSE